MSKESFHQPPVADGIEHGPFPYNGGDFSQSEGLGDVVQDAYDNRSIDESQYAAGQRRIVDLRDRELGKALVAGMENDITQQEAGINRAQERMAAILASDRVKSSSVDGIFHGPYNKGRVGGVYAQAEGTNRAVEGAFKDGRISASQHEAAKERVEAMYQQGDIKAMKHENLLMRNGLENARIDAEGHGYHL